MPGGISPRPELGSAFAISDKYSIFSGRKGMYQKERFRGRGGGIMSVNLPQLKDQKTGMKKIDSVLSQFQQK